MKINMNDLPNVIYSTRDLHNSCKLRQKKYSEHDFERQNQPPTAGLNRENQQISQKQKN